mmetsp:Transcript_73087/g.167620  ORF Transcript_73087/g.167620 Transcript_73087/m.167620 type:complete len:238 (-) Transcript_73087:439-1152(-)
MIFWRRAVWTCRASTSPSLTLGRNRVGGTDRASMKNMPSGWASGPVLATNFSHPGNKHLSTSASFLNSSRIRLRTRKGSMYSPKAVLLPSASSCSLVCCVLRMPFSRAKIFRYWKCFTVYPADWQCGQVFWASLRYLFWRRIHLFRLAVLHNEGLTSPRPSKVALVSSCWSSLDFVRIVRNSPTAALTSSSVIPASSATFTSDVVALRYATLLAATGAISLVRLVLDTSASRSNRSS